jgi:hypothetical protein
MFSQTKSISSYRIACMPDLDVSTPRTHVIDGGRFVVSVRGVPRLACRSVPHRACRSVLH